MRYKYIHTDSTMKAHMEKKQNTWTQKWKSLCNWNIAWTKYMQFYIASKIVRAVLLSIALKKH